MRNQKIRVGLLSNNKLHVKKEDIIHGKNTEKQRKYVPEEKSRNWAVERKSEPGHLNFKQMYRV